jgi:hypothetical protein
MKARPQPLPTDFDSVLDFCLSEIRSGRMTLDECLALFPDLAERLRPVLRQAAALIEMARPTLRPEARDAIEQQLRARMAQLPPPRRAPQPRSAHVVRWASMAAAALLAIGVAGVGTVAAAASSLPGDFLYPVKRWHESAAVQFSSEADRAGVHLSIAQRRLDEFEALTERGATSVALLDEVTAETRLAIAASDALSDPQQADMLTQAADLQTAAMSFVSTVRSQADEATLASLDRALAALADARAAALEHMPPSQLPPTVTHTPRPTHTSTPTSSDTARPRPSHTSASTDDDALTDDQTPTAPGHNTLDSSPTKTPPGQGTPGGGRTRTPPGQGTPGGPPHTPPGPPDSPPGQDRPTKTPKP